MLKVTTETGRTYLIDRENGWWMKMNQDGSESHWERLWSLQKGTHFAFPWESPEGFWEHGDPEIGKFMFISAKDVWWTTTEVVSIEEVDIHDVV